MRHRFAVTCAPLLGLAACSGGGGSGGAASSPSSSNAVLEASQTRIDLGDRDASGAGFDVTCTGGGRLDFSVVVESGNGPSGWLAAAPSHGSSAGEAVPVQITADRSRLVPGSYNGRVDVDAGAVGAGVQVTAAVVGVETSDTAIDFATSRWPVALQVWNRGGGRLVFHVSGQPAWLDVTPTGGASAAARDRSTLTLTVDRTGLAAGHYVGSVAIDPDPDQGTFGRTVSVSMDVAASGGELDVAPPGVFASSGPVGGPFAPASEDFTVANRGDASLDWSASSSAPWLLLSASSGTLDAGASTTVTASIDPVQAALLAAGMQHALVSFTNLTNGVGDTARGVDLAVQDPAVTAVIGTSGNPVTIAPCTLLFHGTDSTEGASPIVRWDWDFGDDASQDLRIDEGMVVAHRFDQPGTYTVNLTVQDARGCTATATSSVTITAFAGATYYVSSSSGDDAADGMSDATPFRTLEHAFLQMAQNRQSAPDRLLLRRGDVWKSDALLVPPKPSVLDAFGVGPLPTIEFGPSDTGFGWYVSPTTPDDWGYAPILQNLRIRHARRRETASLVDAFLHGSVLRGCTIENGGFSAPSGAGRGAVIEDCDVSFARRTNGYVSGDDVVVRRSTFTGAGIDPHLDHQLYTNNGQHWLIEDCVFDGDDNPDTNEGAKLNGLQEVLVRRCEARRCNQGFGAYRNSEEVGLPTPDRYVFEDCVAHDNGYGTQWNGLNVGWMRRLTIRNCIFWDNDAPGGGAGGAIELDWTPVADNRITIVHNVFHSNGLPDVWVAFGNVTKDGQAGVPFNVTLENNVFQRDGAGGSFVSIDDPGFNQATLASDHNVFDWTGKSASDPTFERGDDPNGADTSFADWQTTFGLDLDSAQADPLFSDPARLDFTLQDGSPAIDAGDALPAVFRDRSWVARPRGNGYDAGIFER